MIGTLNQETLRQQWDEGRDKTPNLEEDKSEYKLGLFPSLSSMKLWVSQFLSLGLNFPGCKQGIATSTTVKSWWE